MPAKFRRGEVRKAVNNLRIEIGSAILGNLINTDWDIADIDCRSHIVELSEQYSLCIFFNWIATKFGFPAYTNYIDPYSHEVRLPLVSWPSLANEYPLNVHTTIRLEKAQLDHLYMLMDTSLEPDLNIAGEIYQQSLAAPLAINKLNQVYISKGEKGRSKGEYYSPAWVISRCFDNIFNLDSDTLFSKVKSSLKPSSTADLEHKQKIEGHFKVIDPACGSGNFLLGIIFWLKQSGLEDDEVYSFARNCLYGRDIDGRAASLSRLGVILTITSFFKNLNLTQGADHCAAVLTETFLDLSRHITVQDSLIDGSLLGQRTMAPSEQFDLVVGNPPYISFGARNQPALSKSWQKYIKRSYPESGEYKIRLQSIFQEIAINMTRTGGQIALLLPDAFLNGSFYEKLRRFILHNCQIVSLMELPEDTIAGASVGRWCLAHYKKKSTNSTEVDHPISTSSSIPLFRIHKATPENPEEIQFLMPAHLLVSRDKFRFQLLFSKNEVEIFQFLSQSAFLSLKISGHTGIRARNGQAGIIADKQKSASYKKGLISGGQINPYCITWLENWLDISPERLFAGGFDSNIIGKCKILVRQTADRLIAAVDENGLYHLNNVHSFRAKSATENTKERLHFYCGLLNSNFYCYVYHLKSREHKRAMAQIDIEMVESMPLPPENPEIEELIASASKQLHECRQNRHSQAFHVTDKSPMDNLHEHMLARAIDVFVYELFKLSESQKMIIENATINKGAPLPSVHESRTIVGKRRPALI